MAKVTIQLNREGVRELLLSPEMMAICEEQANNAIQRLGPGYVVSTMTGRNRVNASIIAETWDIYLECGGDSKKYMSPSVDWGTPATGHPASNSGTSTWTFTAASGTTYLTSRGVDSGQDTTGGGTITWTNPATLTGRTVVG